MFKSYKCKMGRVKNYITVHMIILNIIKKVIIFIARLFPD